MKDHDQTPCEKLGYKVGDHFVVLNISLYFDKGELVTLYLDDGTTAPLFENEEGVRWYKNLDRMLKIQDQKQTPCEKLGYKVGDVFQVINDCHDPYFTRNSIIKLIRDESDATPEFELVQGSCSFRNGRAHVHIRNIVKMESDVINISALKHELARADGQITPAKAQVYSCYFDEGQWVITKDDEDCPLHEIINTLNGL